MNGFQAVRFLILDIFCKFVWQQPLDSIQKIPSITGSGHTELYRPLWTTMAEASKALTLLKPCNCKKDCKKDRTTAAAVKQIQL